MNYLAHLLFWLSLSSPSWATGPCEVALDQNRPHHTENFLGDYLFSVRDSDETFEVELGWDLTRAFIGLLWNLIQNLKTHSSNKICLKRL